MKVLFIVAVITCFILVVSAQNCDPEQKVNEIYPCASEINATTVTADFCRNCVNTLIKFSQDCPELNLIVYGEKIDINAEIKRLCPNGTGGSSTVHTVTAFLTALGLTGVAMLMY